MSDARFATQEEIKKTSTCIRLEDDTYSVAGLPILNDGQHTWVDGSDTHTMIFGSTGSKKTRNFILPLTNIIIRGGESFVATDPKGEIYAMIIWKADTIWRCISREIFTASIQESVT